MAENNLNFNQIRNWMPILTSALIVAGAFFSVKTDIAVQTEKIEQMSLVQKDYLQKLDSSDIKLNNHETRITVLESNKQSTVIKSTQIVSAESQPQQSRLTQEITIPQEKSKKPDNKAKQKLEQNEQNLNPSPVTKLVTPLLNILGKLAGV